MLGEVIAHIYRIVALVGILFTLKIDLWVVKGTLVTEAFKLSSPLRQYGHGTHTYSFALSHYQGGMTTYEMPKWKWLRAY